MKGHSFEVLCSAIFSNIRESRRPIRRYLQASRQAIMEAWIVLIGVGGEEKWSDSASFLNVEQTGMQVGWIRRGV